MLKADAAEFKQSLWCIELLTVEALVRKPIYWIEIFQKCNISGVEANDDMNFKTL